MTPNKIFSKPGLHSNLGYISLYGKKQTVNEQRANIFFFNPAVTMKHIFLLNILSLNQSGVLVKPL